MIIPSRNIANAAVEHPTREFSTGVRAVAIGLLMAGSLCSPIASAVVDIGSRLELFLDGELVDRIEGGAGMRMHHPVPKERVMVFDQPWEGNATAYNYVLKDGARYRMYYRAWHLVVDAEGAKAGPNPQMVCYAESDDGIHWRRPDLGLHEFQGSKRNNILFVPGEIGGVKVHAGAPVVFIDENPEAIPDARYKTFLHYQEYGGGQVPFKSPDGIHWTPMSPQPVITDPNFNAFDSQNNAFWDAASGQYRAYWRFYDSSARLRSVRTATSKDFLHWENVTDLRYRDTRAEELYENFILPYHRAPHLLIGLPLRYVERGWSSSMRSLPDAENRRWRAGSKPVVDLNEPRADDPNVTVAFNHGRGATTERERYGTALTDTLIMSSRDGVVFTRSNEAFVRPGPERSGTWNYAHMIITNMVETKPDIEGAPNELSFYASEDYWIGKSSALRRYTLRLDGFRSIHAAADGGEVITKPVRFKGTKLLLNFSTSAAGTVRVELLDERGNPHRGYTLEDCDPVFGDAVDRAVTWSNSPTIQSLAGKAVRLRFVLSEADVFAFRFAE